MRICACFSWQTFETMYTDNRLEVSTCRKLHALSVQAWYLSLKYCFSPFSPSSHCRCRQPYYHHIYYYPPPLLQVYEGTRVIWYIALMATFSVHPNSFFHVHKSIACIESLLSGIVNRKVWFYCVLHRRGAAWTVIVQRFWKQWGARTGVMSPLVKTDPAERKDRFRHSVSSQQWLLPCQQWLESGRRSH